MNDTSNSTNSDTNYIDSIEMMLINNAIKGAAIREYARIRRMEIELEYFKRFAREEDMLNQAISQKIVKARNAKKLID